MKKVVDPSNQMRHFHNRQRTSPQLTPRFHLDSLLIHLASLKFRNTFEKKLIRNRIHSQKVKFGDNYKKVFFLFIC